MDWLLCAEVVPFLLGLSTGLVVPFLLGLSTGLVVVFVSWVVVEVLKTWRGRARVMNVGAFSPRENVRGFRQRSAW